MGSKSPSIASLLLPLLLIIFTLSSEFGVVESTGRKLSYYVPPSRIVFTPGSPSCGSSPASSVFSSKYWTRPCRRARPPGTNIPRP
ncbi:unnamed protein product [Microthlaspi erraticum]|uniref:Transmembrane protein n=1 Tax=Microthlaspi erraticum TaxID=1685480 RepID=A0A6D2JJM2_9BRAS|nr:unnamed protein product [Microthlaspi erraticum]